MSKDLTNACFAVVCIQIKSYMENIENNKKENEKLRSIFDEIKDLNMMHGEGELIAHESIHPKTAEILRLGKLPGTIYATYVSNYLARPAVYLDCLLFTDRKPDFTNPKEKNSDVYDLLHYDGFSLYLNDDGETLMVKFCNKEGACSTSALNELPMNKPMCISLACAAALNELKSELVSN
jgi:hypothetical protein